MARPRKVLSKKELQEVETLAAVLTQSQIADYLGIAERTFRDIMERQPEVSAAYKKGRAKAFSDVGGGLLLKAREGDTASAIFYLKTQAGWREKEAEQQGSDTATDLKSLADRLPD